MGLMITKYRWQQNFCRAIDRRVEQIALEIAARWHAPIACRVSTLSAASKRRNRSVSPGSLKCDGSESRFTPTATEGSSQSCNLDRAVIDLVESCAHHRYLVARKEEAIRAIRSAACLFTKRIRRSYRHHPSEKRATVLSYPILFLSIQYILRHPHQKKHQVTARISASCLIIKRPLSTLKTPSLPGFLPHSSVKPKATAVATRHMSVCRNTTTSKPLFRMEASRPRPL